MSIRFKLALVLSLAVAAATAAASCVFVALQNRSLQSVEDDKVHLLLENVRAMARESQLARDPLMLLDYLSYLERDRPEVLRVRVRFDDRWQGNEPPPIASGELTRTELVAVRGGDGRQDILVELALSRRVLDGRLAAARLAMARDLSSAAAAVLLVGVLLSFPLGWSLTSRLVAVESAMKQVGEGRLNLNVPSSGNDEISRLSRGLNRMIARLKEVDEMKRTFVASVTHELRSPLFAIESYVKELLRESSALSPEDRRRLERVEANAARLARFVTSLLDLAKIERGQLDYRPRVVELARLVEDSAEFQRSRAREGGLSLEFSAEEGLPAIRVDPDLITQVVANLVSNAIKFTRTGGRIMVSVRRRGEGIECAVADTGVGIPRDALARLFKPFERGADPLRAGGTGLGLSISKAIVERHGGRITVESEPGKGSRFWFILPTIDNKSLTQNPS
ncbi:MAG: HAMP domain-containing histidine kinase [Elusimicrobia bacterium]|nr:HAMP domain-containing histidine kinase [Elusimicrobiota bacterium]